MGAFGCGKQQQRFEEKLCFLLSVDLKHEPQSLNSWPNTRLRAGTSGLPTSTHVSCQGTLADNLANHVFECGFAFLFSSWALSLSQNLGPQTHPSSCECSVPGISLSEFQESTISQHHVILSGRVLACCPGVFALSLAFGFLKPGCGAPSGSCEICVFVCAPVFVWAKICVNVNLYIYIYTVYVCTFLLMYFYVFFISYLFPVHRQMAGQGLCLLTSFVSLVSPLFPLPFPSLALPNLFGSLTAQKCATDNIKANLHKETSLCYADIIMRETGRKILRERERDTTEEYWGAVVLVRTERKKKRQSKDTSDYLVCAGFQNFAHPHWQ